MEIIKIEGKLANRISPTIHASLALWAENNKTGHSSWLNYTDFTGVTSQWSILHKSSRYRPSTRTRNTAGLGRPAALLALLLLFVPEQPS